MTDDQLATMLKYLETLSDDICGHLAAQSRALEDLAQSTKENLESIAQSVKDLT